MELSKHVQGIKKMSNTKTRNSAFELLRIISMILIIMHHYSIHAGFDFMSPLTPRLCFAQFLDMGGKIGVNLFVLISGYFLCKSEFKWERILRLELQVIFYSVLIPLMFYIFAPGKASLKDIIKGFTPIRSGEYWFYTVYFFLAIISPFLNKMISSLEKKDFQKLIILLIFLWVVVPLLPKFGALLYSLLGWFILLYLCAAYIRFYPEDFSKTKTFYLAIGVLGYIMILLYVLAFDLLSLININFRNKINYYIPERNILVFISSIMLFIGFSKTNVGSKKIINLISSTTFGIYLLHDNNLTRFLLWKDFFKNANYLNSNFIFIHSIIAISSVFVICSLIDFIRQYVFEKPFFKFIEKTAIRKI